jgi:hypothetical protein
MGGRPRGSRNRVPVDLAQIIVQAAANTGFIVLDKDGKPVAGERGTLGYCEWAAINHPKTFLGLLARVIPYHVIEDRPRAHGLPAQLLDILRTVPAPLDPGEIENPYDIELPPNTADTAE